MQTKNTLQLSVSPMSEKRFLVEHGIRAARIVGVGTPAYGNQFGLTLWKNGLVLYVFNSQLGVDDTKTKAIARALLRNL
jgi:hypothetical protein